MPRVLLKIPDNSNTNCIKKLYLVYNDGMVLEYHSAQGETNLVVQHVPYFI